MGTLADATIASEEQAAYWKGAYERMAARNIELDRALTEIFERHIPDQPASAPGSDYDWAVRQYRELRVMAGEAIGARFSSPRPFATPSDAGQADSNTRSGE